MKKIMKSWSAMLAVLMLVLSLAACGGETAPKEATPTPAPEAEQGQKPEAPAAENAKTVYPLTLKDATGEEMTFDKAPAKVVSLSPSETEKLFALGLDEEIVGVSEVDDYPEAAKSKPKMGGYEMDVEAIVASGADVIFTAAMNEQNVQKLRDLGIKLFVNDPKTIAEVMDNIKVVGEITDRQAEAQGIVDQMQKDLDLVKEAVKSVKDEDKKKVYVEFSPGWTVGKGTYLDEMLNISNSANVAGDSEGWFEISEEKIIAANPDVILYSSNVVDESTKKTLDQIIKERSGWDQIEAVKNNKLIKIDDNLISRPGPRVTQGLVEVAKAVYPELMTP
ncbi:ABC transporter substrate-binding protein [Paenibacillus sp. N3/727]|uniref:ABC transporter substrate-binding protein n=1 Tax=Paenibacillus sp. N3/727 TaxID=2925845 RepID=UPI001F53AA17|nr:ABC transporter substrate-binding protein [Paenibacillus sp. N3/727]UNK17498.1 ABC transporter substrate-binding protein [Paenibacillus sp. N3/727]